MDERMFLTDFETRFAGKNVYSIALAGSTIEQWQSYIKEFYGYQPASLVLCIGTNDVRRGKSADTVYELLVSLFTTIHYYMPDTVIYWWGIMPHIGSEEDTYRIAAVNASVAEYAEYDSMLVYVDCYGAITDNNGIPDRSLFRDQLHPNVKGYDLLFQQTYNAGLVIANK